MTRCKSHCTIKVVNNLPVTLQATTYDVGCINPYMHFGQHKGIYTHHEYKHTIQWG